MLGIGKIFLLLGCVFLLLGGLLTVLGKWGDAGGVLGWVGRLPGDFVIKRDNVTLYFPLATSLVLSVIGSVIMYFLFRR